MTMHTGVKKRFGKAANRFHIEFWLICLIVGLGFIQAIPIGFYKFRLVDLILILSAFYVFPLLLKGRVDSKVRWLILIYLAVMIMRISIEFDPSEGVKYLRTLFGMSAAYLAPLVFFVVRETTVRPKTATWLLIIGCIVAFVSQMGLLPRGEGYAGGLVNLGLLFGLAGGPGEGISLDYTEYTITIWRSLAVGLSFAAVLCRTKPWVKVLGLLGIIFQFSGGGGARSTLLFVLILPLVILLFEGNRKGLHKLKKLLIATSLGVAMGAIYLWAPMAIDMSTKSVKRYSF